MGDSLQEQLAAKLGDLAEDGDGQARAGAEAGDPNASTLGRIALIIEKISGFEAQEVEAAHTPEDLGLGSLERIEVAVRVEETFGARLDDRHVAELRTIGELSEYVEHQAQSGA